MPLIRLAVLVLAAAVSPMSTTAHAAERYLALGDSYTIGEGVAPAERWPVQLAARLRGAGLEIGDPEIVATTGWTTDELSHAMDAAALKPPYALVTLLIGVNNQYRGRSLANYREEFSALLARAIALAGERTDRVIVVSIPDWGVTGFARAQRPRCTSHRDRDRRVQCDGTRNRARSRRCVHRCHRDLAHRRRCARRAGRRSPASVGRAVRALDRRHSCCSATSAGGVPRPPSASHRKSRYGMTAIADLRTPA